VFDNTAKSFGKRGLLKSGAFLFGSAQSYILPRHLSAWITAGPESPTSEAVTAHRSQSREQP